MGGGGLCRSRLPRGRLRRVGCILGGPFLFINLGIDLAQLLHQQGPGQLAIVHLAGQVKTAAGLQVGRVDAGGLIIQAQRALGLAGGHGPVGPRQALLAVQVRLGAGQRQGPVRLYQGRTGRVHLPVGDHLGQEEVLHIKTRNLAGLRQRLWAAGQLPVQFQSHRLHAGIQPPHHQGGCVGAQRRQLRGIGLHHPLTDPHRGGVIHGNIHGRPQPLSHGGGGIPLVHAHTAATRGGGQTVQVQRIHARSHWNRQHHHLLVHQLRGDLHAVLGFQRVGQAQAVAQQDDRTGPVQLGGEQVRGGADGLGQIGGTGGVVFLKLDQGLLGTSDIHQPASELHRLIADRPQAHAVFRAALADQGLDDLDGTGKRSHRLAGRGVHQQGNIAGLLRRGQFGLQLHSEQPLPVHRPVAQASLVGEPGNPLLILLALLLCRQRNHRGAVVLFLLAGITPHLHSEHGGGQAHKAHTRRHHPVIFHCLAPQAVCAVCPNRPNTYSDATGTHQVQNLAW